MSLWNNLAHICYPLEKQSIRKVLQTCIVKHI